MGQTAKFVDTECQEAFLSTSYRLVYLSSSSKQSWPQTCDIFPNRTAQRGLKRRSEEEGDRWAAIWRDLQRRLGLQRWMRDLQSAVRPSVRVQQSGGSTRRGRSASPHPRGTPHPVSPARTAARRAPGRAGTASRTAPRCRRWVSCGKAPRVPLARPGCPQGALSPRVPCPEPAQHRLRPWDAQP